MIRSADVRTSSEARQWEARLNRDRPSRAQVAAWIVSQISSNSADSPRVVELACGAGFLAEVLLYELPFARYCGFDLSPHLLEFARNRLGRRETGQSESGALDFRCADLVLDSWDDELKAMGWAGQVDAVVSMQALHDLGSLEQQTGVLTRARDMLRPGGLLAYADLLQDAANPHPSRYTVDQHAEMLRAAGFTPDKVDQFTRNSVAPPPTDVASARFGDFGCFRYRR